MGKKVCIVFPFAKHWGVRMNWIGNFLFSY